MRAVATAFFLSAFALVGVAGSLAASQAKPPTPIAPFGGAACNTTDIVTMLGKNGVLHNDQHKAMLLIQARVAACKSAINQYIAGLPPSPIIAKNPPGLPPLPTPSPAVTLPPGCSVSKPGTTTPSWDPIQLYSALTYCVSWIASNVPSPAPGTPTPQPIGFHTPTPKSADPWSKAVYVLALASDPLVSAQVALQLANDLREPKMHPDLRVGENPTPVPDIFSNRLVSYHVIAEPTWTLAQYQQQCFNDPSTAGAVVALQPGTVSSLFSLLINISQTNVNMQLIVLDCEPTNTSYVNNAAYITYVSHVRTRPGVRVSASLAQLLGGFALYFAFKPSTTITYKTKPETPIPPGTTYQSQKQVANNLSNVGVAAVGVAGVSSFGAMGEQPSADAQSAGAISALLPELIKDLMWPCTQLRPGDSSFAQPQCDWFSARPPGSPRPP